MNKRFFKFTAMSVLASIVFGSVAVTATELSKAEQDVAYVLNGTPTTYDKTPYCDESDRLIKMGFFTAMASPLGMASPVIGMTLGALVHEIECKPVLANNVVNEEYVHFEAMVAKNHAITIANFAHDSSKPLNVRSSDLVLLQDKSIKKIHVIGYTSTIGEVAYNDELGLRRAMEVAKMIYAQHNMSPDKIELYSKGESEATGDEREDRKVEVFVEYN